MRQTALLGATVRYILATIFRINKRRQYRVSPIKINSDGADKPTCTKK